MKRILTFSLIGQVIYYMALSLVWKNMGWQYNASHGSFLGKIVTVVVLVVNPFVCAYCANRIAGKGKHVIVWLFYLLLSVICAASSNTIYYYASGLNTYWATYSGPNDIKTVDNLVNEGIDILGGVVSGLIFIAIFKIMKSRDKRTHS